MSTETSEVATRKVSLWLDNDEGTYNAVRAIIAESAEAWEPIPELADYYNDPEEGAGRRKCSRTRDAAEALEEWFGERFVSPMTQDTAGPAEELLDWAVAMVDWFDLAAGYLDELEDNRE